VYGVDEGLETEYTISVASSFLRLVDSKPIVDFVTARTFKYYLFRATCHKCTISISVVPFTDTDPDLYVTKGEGTMPDLANFNFSSFRYKGEFLQITEDMEYFKKSNESIFGSYTIGIYSEKNATYSLVVTTSAEILEELIPGIPVKHTQGQGRIKYFTFASWKKKDIKISLAMYSGRAFIRANVIEDFSTSNPLDKLPKTEQASTWSSQAASTNNYLLIPSDDKKFLDTGTYVIAVESLEAIMYDIKVDYQTEEDYSMLQISVPQYDSLKAGKSKLYGVIITNQMDINFSLYSVFGKVKGKIMTGEDRKTEWDFNLSGEIDISTRDPGFRLGMYYIKITAQEDSAFSLTVNQQFMPITLSEGQPYSGNIEQNKQIYFLYRLPQIKATEKTGNMKMYVDVNFVNSLSSGTLYFYHYSDDQALKYDMNAFHKEEYDRSIGHLGSAIDVTHAKHDIAIGLKVIFETSYKTSRFDIVAWTSGVVSMTPSLLYRDSLDSVGDTRTYELAVTKASTVYIEVTPCLGEVEFYVSSSLRETNDRKFDIKKSELSRGRLFGSFQAKSRIYYITVKALETSIFNPIDGKSIWYTIRQSTKDQLDPYETNNYIVENEGQISCSSSGGKVTLSWGNILMAKGNTKLARVRYSIYIGEEGNSNMKTACGMKLTKAHKLVSELSRNSYTWNAPKDFKGKTVVFNIIAVIPEYEQVISYDPVTHLINESSFTGWLGKIRCKG